MVRTRKNLRSSKRSSTRSSTRSSARSSTRSSTRSSKRTSRRKQRGGFVLYGNSVVSVQQDPYSPTVLMDYDTYTATKNTADPRF